MSFKFELPDWYNNNNPQIIKQVTHDVQHKKKFNYLFQGIPGCGKTTLSKIIFKNLKRKFREENIEMRINKVYADKIYRRYLFLLNSNYTDSAESLEKISCLGGDVLLFDDIGDERPPTSGARSFIAGLIKDRFVRWESELTNITIFTTNLKDEELRRYYGEKILSRIEEMFITCRFQSLSYRSKLRRVINENNRKT